MRQKQVVLDINTLIRKNILNMKPYSSARDEFNGKADIYLDANENPFPSSYNRYPDPLQFQVKEEICRYEGIKSSQLFLGNGSDEAIDLLIRAFCEPNKDSILVTEPTYGMYRICAEVNAVNVQHILLTHDFDLDLDTFLKSVTNSTKIVFLCSPNNPTGKLLGRERIEAVLKQFNGLVVIDEAYIDFASSKSFLEALSTYSNLVVLRTFSKAWGLAGLRLGLCFASEEIIAVLNKIKHPYNISSTTQELALEALKNRVTKENWVKEVVQERDRLTIELKSLPQVQHVFPSDANFILVRVTDAHRVYNYLMTQGIIVRNRSSVALCFNCLRITVGTHKENKRLIQAIKEL